jgi:hypothetical protein
MAKTWGFGPRTPDPGQGLIRALRTRVCPEARGPEPEAPGTPLGSGSAGLGWRHGHLPLGTCRDGHEGASLRSPRRSDERIRCARNWLRAWLCRRGDAAGEPFWPASRSSVRELADTLAVALPRPRGRLHGRGPRRARRDAPRPARGHRSVPARRGRGRARRLAQPRRRGQREFFAPDGPGTPPSPRLPRFLNDTGAPGGRAKAHFEPPSPASFETSEGAHRQLQRAPRPGPRSSRRKWSVTRIDRARLDRARQG